MFGNKQKNKAGKKAGSRSPVKRRSTSKRPSRKGRKIFASIAEEKDWDTEVPGLRISRAFGVVLIVHVIAVLGLLIHAMGNKSNTPNSPVDEAQHETLPEIGGYGKGNLAVSESSNLSSETSAAVVTVSPSTATPNESAAINTAPETVASTAAIAPEPRVESYRIISGDSLYGIAKRLGVPLEDLVRANGLDTGQEIYPGQKLYIPSKQIGKRKMEQARQLLTQEMSVDTPPATREVPSTQANRENLAQSAPADSSYSAYIGSAPSIEKVPSNGSTLTGYRSTRSSSSSAQSILSAPTTSPKTAAPAVSAVAVKTHRVSQGETAYGLAKLYKISMDRLLKINQIADPRNIKTGTVLRVPSS